MNTILTNLGFYKIVPIKSYIENSIMKKASCFFTLFILFSLVMQAQSGINSLPKTSEQKEIKATNHLKKEMEMKQLTAPPERIADSAAVLKTSKIKKNKRSKFSIKKTNF